MIAKKTQSTLDIRFDLKDNWHLFIDKNVSSEKLKKAMNYTVSETIRYLENIAYLIAQICLIALV